MERDKIVVLCPREAISIETQSILPADIDTFGMPALFAEDAVEDMVVCLAAIEAAWAAGEFQRLAGTLVKISELADRTGLTGVGDVAVQASELVNGKDDIALAAVIARLVRVGEASLATLLEIGYRQI